VAAAAGPANAVPSPAEREAPQAKTPPASAEPVGLQADTGAVASSAASTPSLLWVIVSAALLLVGLALVVLRLAARRAAR
jgi:hypothetical protein